MNGLEHLSNLALMNLKWLVKLWRHGYRNGAAFDLDVDKSDDYESHPDVIALRGLELEGYVKLSEDEVMKLCWTLGADLTPLGIELAEDENFDDQVPSDTFPWP